METLPSKSVRALWHPTGIQLQPFLVIGIILATRDILTVGAELSLISGRPARTMTELGVNAAVVVAFGGPGPHTAFRPA